MPVVALDQYSDNSSALLSPLYMNTGVGSDSEKISAELEKVVEKFFESATAGLPLQKALQALEEVFEETSEPGWDGYDALPVPWEARLEAEILLRRLPPSIPMPEIVPEPDGEIGLEWYKRKRLTFAASVSGQTFRPFSFSM